MQKIMQKVAGCVDLKLDESMQGGCYTQDESMHGGFALIHVRCETQDESIRREDVSIHECVRLRMSRHEECMCRYMLY